MALKIPLAEKVLLKKKVKEKENKAKEKEKQ